ncbi:hypothetical protein GCM10010371_46180 [Streptomyces subrutilus]|uniref:Uncharacterized protein n=1 Tax=Streptomyces subrutilus TaxID=36818 RepID=A0A5P2UT04_9ACTN|nr:hypothetical protein [Streptomyces subrutilus]QEU82472.1 hypothetical protein CP968_33210 [Streptomyces subrutilus]GGZ81450.1 hypothetical protein GCM10010371_46180 [Streptomyces subrutilus]
MTGDGPHVVVRPPDEHGGRRVHVDGRSVGIALGPADVLEFLRRAGIDPDEAAPYGEGLIDWQGGGPAEWGRP